MERVRAPDPGGRPREQESEADLGVQRFAGLDEAEGGGRRARKRTVSKADLSYEYIYCMQFFVVVYIWDTAVCPLLARDLPCLSNIGGPLF